jgi:transcriptional regulator with XRE-family HTH domain
MTMTISSRPRRPAPLPRIGSPARRSATAARHLRPGAIGERLSKLGARSRSRQAKQDADRSGLPASPPGAIGGAIITAARRSAGLTRRALARRLAVPPATMRPWESGACPLYCVGYDQLRQLAAALDPAGTQAVPALEDLLLASQCDLLVAGMLGGFEDYTEVPPVDHETDGQASRSLLRWALTGDVPERYRRHAPARPLLARRDAAAFAALARGLADGAAGPELSSYGAALLNLAAS